MEQTSVQAIIDALNRSGVVFSTFSPRHAATEIDLFVETPFDFEPVYTRCERFEVAPGIVGTFIGRNDLIEMKRKAGRPLDLQDAEGLREMGT